ncbi:MAG: putative aliphatic sulfonates transport permease protein ssuC [Hyphomicrobiales bacterium]|nr:putative aliphatic sulfonates transport permease protein ssuC [Hyphomicrobiales bacterium]
MSALAERPAIRPASLVASFALPASVARLLLAVALLAAWQFAPSFLLDDMLVSRPTLVAARIVEWVGDGVLIRESVATLSAVFLGLFWGGLAGSAVGLIAGMSRAVGKIVEPWLTVLFALPKSAFIPLFILWFGISGRQHMLFVATVVFFFFFFAMYRGVQSVPLPWRNMLAISGAGALQSIRMLYLPASFGWMLSALRLAIPSAFVAAISVEVIASREGLGHLVKTSSAVLDSAGTVAAIVWLVALATALGASSIALADRSRWRIDAS